MKTFLNNVYKFFRSIGSFIDKKIIIPIAKLFVNITTKFTKNGKALENILLRKNSLIIISLLLAVGLFFVVDSESNLLIETSAQVIYNQSVSAEYNKEAYVIEGLPEAVDITLIGRRADLYLAKQISNHNITVDLTGLEEGVHKVNLQYTQAVHSVEYKLDPSVATIVISKKESEKKSITTDIVNSDKLDAKLHVKSIITSRDEVVVKGTNNTINSIASIKALIDVSQISNASVGKNELKNIPLIAYDKLGNKIDVELVPSTIEATVNIVSPKAELPIKIVPTGDVVFGKSISSMTTNLNNVTVYGDEDIIKNMTDFKVEINVEGLSDNKEYNVTLTKPVGVKYMTETNLKVKIVLGEETTKEISGVGISAINLDTTRYSAQAIGVNNRTVTVIVKGVQDSIKNITAESIKATIDLKGYKEGTYDVPVVVTGEDLKVIYAPKETTKKIQISKVK